MSFTENAESANTAIFVEDRVLAPSHTRVMRWALIHFVLTSLRRYQIVSDLKSESTRQAFHRNWVQF
jgi:hypothetical protein